MSPSKLKKIRIAGLSALSFVFMFTYAIARPATESLFLQAHTSKSLPIAWILVALGMLAVVTVYSRFVGRYELINMYGWVSLISGLLFLLLAVAQKFEVPGVYYALYILKDVYIMAQAEIFYSYANSVFPIKTARWTYGFFGLVSGVGGVLGGLFVGWLAKKYGTVYGLYIVPPLLVLPWLACFPFSKIAGAAAQLKSNLRDTNILEAFKVLKGSSYLFLILLLVVLTQMAITMIDFEYNAVLQQVYPDVDQRTAIIGQVYAVINAGTIILHGFTGPILRVATVPITLLFMPFILGAGLSVYLVVPVFMAMAFTKVGSKLFDYTLFRSAKEILYIPLSYAEKTLGKSIVDMLMYRVAKGGASIALMVLIALKLGDFASWMALVLIALWLVVTIIVVKRFRQKVSREEEISSSRVGE